MPAAAAHAPAQEPPAYVPRRPATSRILPLRGWNHHLQVWGEPEAAGDERPLLVLLHGWMDVGASFQFVVDALTALEGPVRPVVAPDWRGFGRSVQPAGVPPPDSFWFPDYLADLDALLNALSPGRPVDLVGHSMGGNVVMSYAGVRPETVRRLVNLEGFGLPDSPPEAAPERLARWLDELATPMTLRDYASAAEVADRLRRNNPRLPADKAAWLATQWAEPGADGRWRVRGDAAHRRINPVPYRAEEAVATWRRIRAPLLWVEGEATDVGRWWGDRYPRSEFERRLASVGQVERAVLADAGHMLHHDQPEALARRLHAFLVAP